jgi:hypothetical protein
MRVFSRSLGSALLALLLTTLAAPAFAADGDLVRTTNKGDFISKVFKLCDADTANVTCSEFDLNRAGLGKPTYVSVWLEPNTCTVVDVQPRWKPVASGTAANLTTSLSYGGTTAAVQDLIPGTIIDAVITNINCTSITVILEVVYKRPGL